MISVTTLYINKIFFILHNVYYSSNIQSSKLRADAVVSMFYSIYREFDIAKV